jgi:hypothetical protein
LNESIGSESESLAEELDMPMKKYQPERIVTLLRQAEVESNETETPSHKPARK